MSVDRWTQETIHAVGQALYERLEQAEPDEVPGWFQMEASDGKGWAFKVTVQFTHREPLTEEEFEKLFGVKEP